MPRLVIGGQARAVRVEFENIGQTPVHGVVLHADIVQGATVVAGNTGNVRCGVGVGTVPAGLCSAEIFVRAAADSGLAVGDAFVVLSLVQGGYVIDTIAVPITIQGAAALIFPEDKEIIPLLAETLRLIKEIEKLLSQ